MGVRRERRHALLLGGVVTGMFAFAFALVPLYAVFCEITGLNGKTAGRAASVDQVLDREIATDREVTIQFLASVSRGMPWEFRPTRHEMRVRVGEMQTATYFARNRADDPVTGQAVPSVSPGQAARYLEKIECFCFSQQELDGGGETEMPVRFVVSDELPADIRELTLSYTLFRVDEPAGQEMAAAQ